MKKEYNKIDILDRAMELFERTSLHSSRKERRTLIKFMNDHEFDRIKQFETEADGNEEKFRQKVLLRAARSSNEKKKRFAAALKAKGYESLATFIDGIMINH